MSKIKLNDEDAIQYICDQFSHNDIDRADAEKKLSKYLDEKQVEETLDNLLLTRRRNYIHEKHKDEVFEVDLPF